MSVSRSLGCAQAESVQPASAVSPSRAMRWFSSGYTVSRPGKSVLAFSMSRPADPMTRRFHAKLSVSQTRRSVPEYCEKPDGTTLPPGDSALPASRRARPSDHPSVPQPMIW